ncbi:MAG TPA: TetR family transcriptional regulator [Acidimicrobiales bacterium]|nr:TetR family transcriptional regulator [Acidimicrobiales bacterium]
MTTEALSGPAAPRPEHAGRRDRKKLATRQALVLAALELVAQRGFSHVTVEDIAAAADVSTRTFFNYFPSKEAAIIGEGPEELEALRADLLAQPDELPPLEALRATMLSAIDRREREAEAFGPGRPAWLHRCQLVNSEPVLRAALAAHGAAVERILTSALASRLGVDPEADPYPAVAVLAATGATRAAVMFWGRTGGRVPIRQVVEAAFDLLAAGLADHGRAGRARAAQRGRGARRAQLASPAPASREATR